MVCGEQVESVATTLSLAEQNHAEELKRVCLEFVSRNLQAVMLSEGYQHMVNSCPQLQVTASQIDSMILVSQSTKKQLCIYTLLDGHLPEPYFCIMHARVPSFIGKAVEFLWR